MRQVAKAMHLGADRYGEDNWRGLPASVCVNHAIRHLFAILRGDKGENHAAHAAANCLMICELLDIE